MFKTSDSNEMTVKNDKAAIHFEKIKQTKKFKIRGDDRQSEIGLANEKIENCRGSGHRMFETSDSNETTVKIGKGAIHFEKTQSN